MAKDDKAEVLLQTLIDAVWITHKLRAVGARAGAVNASGGGTWGVLHTLVRFGPMTVPQIARMRPVARQHIQTLANELAERGLVEFRNNPAHKRSRLIALTKAGEAHYEDIKANLLTVAREMAAGTRAEDIEAASRVIVHVMSDLDRRLETGEVAAGRPDNGL